MSKNVQKTYESVVQVFTFVHFEIANGHFSLQNNYTCHVMHTTLYLKKLFIFG